jgi:hypothetical protein
MTGPGCCAGVVGTVAAGVNGWLGVVVVMAVLAGEVAARFALFLRRDVAWLLRRLPLAA